VKRLLFIISGIALGAAIFAAGALTLLWLFSDNNVSINLSNDSKAELHNVGVIIPGSPFPAFRHEMPPITYFAFSAETRSRLPIRVVFDAGGRHYDVPVELHLAPFGSFVVSISIDERMQVRIKKKFA